MALSSLRQNQKRANFIDQHDNAPADTARLTFNFQVVNIMFVLDRPPLSQDMSAIKLLIATLKTFKKGYCYLIGCNFFITHYFKMKFKIYFADILILIVAKFQ